MFILVNSLIIFCVISLFINYAVLSSGWQYIWNWDSFSRRLVTLTLWILIVVCLTERKYLLPIQILGIIILVLFNVKNLFLFFILFEFSILPILWIIIINGKQSERLIAGISLLIYTFTARTTLFWGLLSLYWKCNSLRILFVVVGYLPFILLLIFTFLVKLPIWRFHQWLPKAHVEAPVGGSIILASILLKLGIYGIYRFILLRNGEVSSGLKLIARIGLLGMLISGLASLFTRDIKILIAYSSVSHLSPSLLVIINYNSLRLTTIILLSVSHGYVSRLIFYSAHLVYLNSKTRLLLSQKGLLLTSPTLSLLLGWVIILNLSIPPFFPFYAEIGIFMSLLIQRYLIVPVVFMVVLISGGYNLILFVTIIFGKDNNLLSNSLNVKDLLVFLLHLFPCFLIPFLI